MEEVIEGKLNERQHTLLTERQRQNIEKKKKRMMTEDCDNYEDDWFFESEGWERKKGGTYFTQKKFKRLSCDIKNNNKKLKTEAIDSEMEESAVLDEKTNTEETENNYNETRNNTAQVKINYPEEEKTETFKDLFARNLKYPKNFLQNNKIMYGINLTARNFETLMLNERLDDNIINATFKLLEDMGRLRGFRVLVLETFFSSEFIDHGTLRCGFKNWAKSVKMESYGVWISPIHYDNHWTLLITKFWNEDLGTGNKNWEIVRPEDISLQNVNPEMTWDNCGVHVITWGHCIVTSSYCPFDESNMTNARIGISKLLWCNKKLEREKSSTVKYRKVFFENSNDKFEDLNFEKLTESTKPPLYFRSTFEYCASLKYMIANEPYSMRKKKNFSKC
ncbi:hypothetical protein KQX54_016459 [Cotesia glomerata]|uniref:Ubiquitin-like protease family profile domain-containing protein n=1 Tax=Cotesia glomerata TaxID=32391 RepID=A0AAV7J731_COTGL|nr:hypothetical protein KQX54_016459 [Cotesia glomerata]